MSTQVGYVVFVAHCVPIEGVEGYYNVTEKWILGVYHESYGVPQERYLSSSYQ